MLKSLARLLLGLARRLDSAVIAGLPGEHPAAPRVAAPHEIEQTLRDQIALTQAIVERTPTDIFVKDAQGRFTMVNRSWSASTGVPAEQAIGKTVHELYPPEVAQRIAREDAALLAQGAAAAPIEAIHRGPRPNQWRVVRKAVLSRDDGTVQGLISTSTDISEMKRVEQELADRAKFIGELVDALPISVAMRDIEGRYVLVNRTWERFSGVKREEVLGRRRRDFPGWETDPALLAEAGEIESVDRDLLARGPDHIAESEEVRRLGRYYLMTRRVLADSAGKPLGVLSAGMDLTERRAMEEALAAERQRLALVVSATNAGIIDWDTGTEMPWYSERFKEMLGYPPDTDTSAWASVFGALMHPEDRDRSREVFFTGLVRPGAPNSVAVQEPFELRLRRADGGWLWVQSMGLTVHDEAGEVKRYLAAVTDISERRAQEEALSIEQRRLDLVVRAAKVGTLDWDGRTRTVYYSPRLKEILGYAPDADTSDWPDVFKSLIHPEDSERVRKAFREHILGTGPGGKTEHQAPMEYRVRRADGSYVWVEAQGVVVRDATGFAARFIATYTDITGRRAQEEELRQSVRLREEVERMSRHDLKTPINSVVAMVRLLREGERVAPEDAELLGTIERAGYRILNMVNLSLDLFRMETGTYEFVPRAVDLAEVVRRVAADLESQAASKNIDVRVRANDVSAATQEVLAQGDELLCYSMFANLVKNAIEAAPAGGTVSVLLHGQEDAVLAEVHNPGVVPEAIRGRFFQKYATTGKSAGLGLGTYSARLMARVQDGELSLETSEEGGTTLSVRLKPAGAGLPRASESREAGNARAEAQKALPALRVLVVDDDEFNRLVLRRYLPSPPLKVAFAVNGRAALEAAQREWPDVILLDLEMPVMDGYEAARRLRAMERDENRKRCLIVAISSNNEASIIERALAAGCDRYIIKPAPRQVLWSLLGGAAAGSAAEGAAAATTADNTALGMARASDTVILEEDLRHALPGFLRTRRELLDAMQAALGADDRALFKRHAHHVAGSFAIFGFKWAATEASALEANALSGDAADLGKRATAIRAHLDGAAIEFAPGEGAAENS